MSYTALTPILRKHAPTVGASRNLGSLMEEISKAMAAFAAEITNPTKDQQANAGQYSYKYAGLDRVLAHVRPVLAKHGLFITQDVQIDADGVLLLLTTVHHASGQTLEFGPVRVRAGQNPQQIGSNVTYMRRYALVSALGIAADEDDDGAAASQPKKVTRSRAKKDDEWTVSGSVKGGLEDNQTKAKQIQVFQMLGGYLGTTKPSDVNAKVKEITGVDHYKDLTLEQGVTVLEWVAAHE